MNSDPETYKVRLEIFEGPLDLLLHLIRQQEIDIHDIPIAKITDQYLNYLQMMKDLNISVAGEFLHMAATLIYIKSRTLLPPDPVASGQEESEDPRRELVEQLIEHEKFKKAAHMLYEKETVELASWPTGLNEFEEEEKETVVVTLFDLVSAFHRIVERYKEQVVMDVHHESVTLEEKLAEIRCLLKVQAQFFFSFFLQHRISRLHLVVTFLALLELVRLKEVRLFQKAPHDDIRIVAC
ncbi:MAG: segregation/condensation protein A [Acidobacteria bacterium]|nr:segregation/condensation protein A [Acidobacteriota bacterium]